MIDMQFVKYYTFITKYRKESNVQYEYNEKYEEKLKAFYSLDFEKRAEFLEKKIDELSAKKYPVMYRTQNGERSKLSKEEEERIFNILKNATLEFLKGDDFLN